MQPYCKQAHDVIGQQMTVSYRDGELLPGTQPVGEGDAEFLLPGELQGVCGLVGQELERHDAHPHQLVLVQLLEALGNDGANALLKQRRRGGQKMVSMGDVCAECGAGVQSYLPAGTALWQPSPWSFQTRSPFLPE